jgi:hypothetical protein
VQPNPQTDWALFFRDVRIRVRRVLPSSNPPKLTTHPTHSHPSTQREKQQKKLPSLERKLLFACFLAVLII